MPEGLRIRDTESHRFVFNYAATAQDWNDTRIPAAGVHWEALS
jgi:beta-galactosidase